MSGSKADHSAATAGTMSDDELAYEVIRDSVANYLQSDVYANVEQRGYTRKKDGTPWGVDQFACRQAMKAIDEVGEIVSSLVLGVRRTATMYTGRRAPVIRAMDEAAWQANGTFKDQDAEYESLLHVEVLNATNKVDGLDFRPQTSEERRLAAEGVIEECADVVIPLLCLCEQLRRDYGSTLPSLLEIVARKSAADVARGVSQ